MLSLSKNAIEKIEKLDKLTHLRELNLSFNCIAKIEHLEALTSLQVLDLSGNNIESIPAWLSRKLKALRVFKIIGNRIQTVSSLLQFLYRLICLLILFFQSTYWLCHLEEFCIAMFKIVIEHCLWFGFCNFLFECCTFVLICCYYFVLD